MHVQRADGPWHVAESVDSPSLCGEGAPEGFGTARGPRNWWAARAPLGSLMTPYCCNECRQLARVVKAQAGILRTRAGLTPRFSFFQRGESTVVYLVDGHGCLLNTEPVCVIEGKWHPWFVDWLSRQSAADAIPEQVPLLWHPALGETEENHA